MMHMCHPRKGTLVLNQNLREQFNNDVYDITNLPALETAISYQSNLTLYPLPMS